VDESAWVNRNASAKYEMWRHRFGFDAPAKKEEPHAASCAALCGVKSALW
jgi:hypothetical protein